MNFQNVWMMIMNMIMTKTKMAKLNMHVLCIKYYLFSTHIEIELDNWQYRLCQNFPKNDIKWLYSEIGNTKQARTGSLINNLKLNNRYHHPIALEKRWLQPTTPQLPKLSSSTTITAVPWQELNDSSPIGNDSIVTSFIPPASNLH